MFDFNRLEVYEEPSSDDLKFVPWAATLTFEGASAFRGFEPSLGEGWVIDGCLVDAAGTEIPGAQAIGGTEVRVAEFTLNNADKLSIHCKQATLSLLEALEAE